MKTLKVDAPPTTEDEALELMIHHLLLAATYFEATKEGPASRAEMLRLIRSKARAKSPAEFGCLAFFDAIEAAFERLKD